MAEPDPVPPAAAGAPIEVGPDGQLRVPDVPIIPFIEGDGSGPDIWAATRPVLDAAVARAYGGRRRIEWLEVLAGEKALGVTGGWLPEETVGALSSYRVAIRGPFSTGSAAGGLNPGVALRRLLDLFAIVRPIRHFRGVPTPVKYPDRVNVVIFRESTEDLYSGVEWPAGSEGAQRVIALAAELGFTIREGSGIGIKAISELGSRRLVRMAIRHAIDRGLPSVTLVHKGNILKATEGAFRDWGYAVAREEFPDASVAEAEVAERHGGRCPTGRIVIQDRSADAMFQQMLFRPGDYSVLAVPNQDGDYLSDAVLAQVGGLGLAPGASMGEGHAIFEATHGAAPRHAGLDIVNPGSVILSGAMLLDHLGWEEAGGLIHRAVERTVARKLVTFDLERLIEGATKLKCSEFGRAVQDHLG